MSPFIQTLSAAQGAGKRGMTEISAWNGIRGSGGVVLRAMTVHKKGRPCIFGLMTITGRVLTISGALKPALKSLIRIVPAGGRSLIGMSEQVSSDSFSYTISGFWRQGKGPAFDAATEGCMALRPCGALSLDRRRDGC
jgi:hypothetical protein